jgi:hypothetical protein
MKWEYFTKYYQPNSGMDRDINLLGEEGWELFAVVLNDQDVARCFFKRLKPQS